MKRWMTKRVAAWGAGVAAALLAVAQLIPVDRTNPADGTDPRAPEEALQVLRRSCYDCHSNETVWPWYSKVAPASWLLARDVAEGRDAVNYSLWAGYPRQERAELLEETWEEVAEGEMPPALYVLMHPEARLSAADRAALRAWTNAGAGAPSASRRRAPPDEDD